MGKPRDQNESIQGLRAAAALLVVADHSLLAMRDKAGAVISDEGAYALGELGVHMFFVISGFIMTTTMWEKFGTAASIGPFAKRRLIRIVPLYWLATVLFAARLAWGGEPPSGIEWLKSLFFIPYRNDAGELAPIYGLGWTLNFEMFFYAAFALVLALRRELALSLLLAFLCGLVVFRYSGIDCGARACDAISLYTRPTVLFFAGGVVLGVVRKYFESRDVRLRWGPSLAMGLSLPLIVAYSAMELQEVASPQMLFVGGVACVAVCTSLCALATTGSSGSANWFKRGAVLAGDASYSIYLTHSFMVGVCSRVWASMFGDARVFEFVALMLAGAIVLGWLSYRWIEVPVLRHMRRYVG